MTKPKAARPAITGTVSATWPSRRVKDGQLDFGVLNGDGAGVLGLDGNNTWPGLA